MINAKEARLYSNLTNEPKIRPFQAEVEKIIKEESNKGFFECKVKCPSSIENYIIERFCCDLMTIDYEAFTIYNKSGKTESIIIKW